VGDSTRLRVAAGGIAVAALVFGSARVAALDRRTLAVGPVRDAVVVVTGQPSGGHGLAAVRGAGETVVLSMPGIVLAVHARAGQRVKRGDLVCVVEAMKMELRVEAPGDGTVTKVLCAQGDQVKRGQRLAEFEGA
jgi:biotin carboxyl carrier protein